MLEISGSIAAVLTSTIMVLPAVLALPKAEVDKLLRKAPWPSVR